MPDFLFPSDVSRLADPMNILFARSHTVGSLIVRVGTLSVWGHVGIVTPESTEP